MNPLPQSSVRATRHIIATADQLATRAGDEVFSRGGNAVDAAIAANAAIAVTGPHLCGMGGDLFALVHTEDEVIGLNASGRAGSGADADELRADGHQQMPFRHDVRSVTVPGCVDGWMALHERFGSMPLEDVLAPAVDLADGGFAAGPLLVGSIGRLDDVGRRNLSALADQAVSPGARVRLPGVAEALRAIVAHGRDGFYGGPFGEGLVALGAGLFADDDLARSQADWVDPISAPMFGVDVHTIGPNSQGYLTLAGGAIADTVDLPDDPDDPAWPHLLIEAAKLAGHDRNAVLHEHADGGELVAAALARADRLDPHRASNYHLPSDAGDTTYLCAAEADGLAVSLIQSNASGFGSWLAEPNTGINLHNRGLGFSLTPDHPAEVGAGRRPPHTLSPALATEDGELRAVFGTMGGDAQPQVLLQVAARLFRHGASAAASINAPRWALAGGPTGFDTWAEPNSLVVGVEGHAPIPWLEGLADREHDVRRIPPYDSTFGHAHAIVIEPSGSLSGAADPRARIGAATGR